MQYALKVTLWDGFSFSPASLASEPWKNWPAGMVAMRAGHVGAGGAALGAGGALAMTGAALDATGAAAGVLPPEPPLRKNAAPAAAASSTPPPTRRPSFDLASSGRGPVVAALPPVVASVGRTNGVEGASS